jgi:NAD(P)-dependent dehydrogenase (short-subunit alcohol dehydrogenase family)
LTDSTLHGRSVIVTGGGTGIGAACAHRAAEHGAKVTICGRTESRLDASAERIRGDGGDVHTVVADVTVEDDVARLVAAAVEFGGGLHGVVANAGGGGGLAPYHLQDVDEFVRVLHLNVVSTMLCIKHAVPQLARSGGGSFVGMSSIAGHVTHPYFGAYPVAKAGIESMIRNAADEYGRLKIRFNAIQPGFITTEIMEGIPRGGPVWNSYVDQTPLGDVGRPEDIADVARFLLSDEARWITGQTLAVDGGHCLRRGPDFGSFVELMFDPTALDPTALDPTALDPGRTP